MDEPTTRVVVHVTDDMRDFLEQLAVSQNFEKRAIPKAIRFCIRQEMRRGAAAPASREDRERTAFRL